VTIKQIFFNKF